MHAYKNPSLPISDRVEDLLSRMTLKEKTVQLFHHWKTTDTHSTLEPSMNEGVGTVYSQWVDVVALQRHCVENTRLGIPANIVQETLHGGTDGGTIFPMPIAMAATWNPELLHRAYTHIAKEARMRGINGTLSPNLDVHTDPRFGRVDESFGEDPYLTSCLGVVSVKAYQGEGEIIDQEHIAATAKHFAAYGMAENGQDGGRADLSEQTLREVYLPPFQAAVRAGLKGIMAAHNEVNGVPCHANEWLLREILRKEWGFDGMLISDAGDVNLLCAFGLARDFYDAGVQAMNAGIDQEMYVAAYLHLEEAVQNGDVAESLLDDAVRRVLTHKFQCGLFENPIPSWCAEEELDSAEGRTLAYEVAVQSMVLLKNDREFLPLDASHIQTLAVIGPNRDHPVNQMGPYTRRGAHVVTPLEGLRNRLSDDVTLLHCQGCDIMNTGEEGCKEAVDLARKADAVVLVLGDSLESCRECYGAKTGDRTELGLSGGQTRLLREVSAVNPNTVLVLINGRPQAIVDEQEWVPAVLNAWRCGEEGGHAIADLLFGAANPSGHLTMTTPRRVGQLPAVYYRKKRSFKQRMYSFETPDPLYPFGYGLSYTTFQWNHLHVFPETVCGETEILVSLEVTNTGARDGAEVVQIYAHDPLASMTRPVRQLVGFARVNLRAGETQKVEIPVQVEQFGYYDRSCRFVLDQGEIEVMAARDAGDEGLRTTIVIGEAHSKRRGVQTEGVTDALIPDG